MRNPIILMALVLAAGQVYSEETQDSQNRRQIEALVTKLKSDEFSEREKAAESLKTMGKSVVPVLKELEPNETDPEAKSQIKSILGFFAPLKAVVKDPTLKITASNRARRDNLVILDGRPSVDANGGQELTYQWKQIEGPDLRLSAQRMTKDRLGMLVFIPGKYRFQLTVSDGKKDSEPAYVDLTVEEEKKEDKKDEKKDETPKEEKK